MTSLSDRLNEALRGAEGLLDFLADIGQDEDLVVADALVAVTRAYVDLVNGERVEPDYEAALERMAELVGLPVAVHVRDFVSPGMEGEERKQALEALRQADREADIKNIEVVRAIIDAAIGDRLLIDPPKEEE